jgi:protoporphyrinogen oxidase
MAGHDHAKSSDDEHNNVKKVDILIIGAGPTGLGAASRLHQLSSSARQVAIDETGRGGTNNDAPLDYLLIDAAPEPGGLSSTYTTEEGFLFDLGGHVIFSHFTYFDQLLEACVGRFDDKTKWARHERKSYVYMQNVFIPYPFQLHLGYLPNLEDRIECLNGLIEARVAQAVARTRQDCLQQQGQTSDETKRDSNSRAVVGALTFHEWIEQGMGSGINRLFMKPYNFKVWAYPTNEMSSNWLGERVAEIDTTQAVRNVITQPSLAANDNNHQPEKKWGECIYYTLNLLYQ